MIAHRRHQSTQRPATLAVVAVVCLLGYLSGLLHLVLVRHATCPEHDEITHAGASEVVTSEVSETAAVAPAAAEQGHADDHCLVVATTRRQAAPPGAAAQVIAAPAGAVLGSFSAHLFVADPIAVLLVAPKNSPPATRV